MTGDPPRRCLECWYRRRGDRSNYCLGHARDTRLDDQEDRAYMELYKGCRRDYSIINIML